MKEGDSLASTCCEQVDEHSGQMFDWWRCSQEGKIVQVPRAPPPPPPRRPPPLRTDQLCWPMYQVSRFENIVKESEKSKAEPEECNPSRDFWPSTEKRCARKPPSEHARPPWKPAFNSSSCGGAVNYAQPCNRTCKDRQKPVVPFVSRP